MTENKIGIYNFLHTSNVITVLMLNREDVKKKDILKQFIVATGNPLNICS